MRRRTLLGLGAAGAAVLALAGGTLALLRPGWEGGKLTPAGRELFGAIARAVLEGIIPDPTASMQAHHAALRAHLDRLEATIAGMPAVTQAEIAELSSLLLHPAGRYVLTGLGADWTAADTPALRAALQGLRESRLALRQQIFHALRDLTNGAYFADQASWDFIGYPGPLVV
jgi:hypothetical protein